MFEGPRDVFRKSASSTRQIVPFRSLTRGGCIGRRSGRAAHLGAIRGIDRYEPSPRNRFADEREHDPRSTLHGAGMNEWSKAVELPNVVTRLLGNHDFLGITRLLTVSRDESRAKSRTAICTLKSAEGSQSGDGDISKNPGKSCTPHSRVSIGPPYVSSEIACGSNHSPPWKWGLGTDETWVKSLSLCGLWGLEGTRRYLSPSREVAAAIPRSREGAATHAGVDRRWHTVCDTEGIDERHTGARLHGGTRDPRRGVTEGQSSVSHRPREIVPGRAGHRRDTRARGPYFPGLSR